MKTIKLIAISSLLVSINVFANSTTDFQKCVQAATSANDMPGTRSCLITYLNTSTPIPIKKGTTLTSYSNSNGFLVFNARLDDVTFNPLTPEGIKYQKEFSKHLDEKPYQESRLHSYCSLKPMVKQVFPEGSISRFYDKNGQLITVKTVTSDMCKDAS